MNSKRTMNRSIRAWPLGVLAGLFALFANVWMWDSDMILLGFPINLLYHVGLCVLASGAMLSVVAFGWPHELDQDDR